MSIMKEEIGESKSGSREGHVDNIDMFSEDPLPHDTVKNLTEEEKEAYGQYRQAMWKHEMCKRELKTIEVLIKHLEDEKSYTINLDQLESIEKAGDSEKIMKAANDAVEKGEVLSKSEDITGVNPPKKEEFLSKAENDAFDTLVKGAKKGHYRTTKRGVKFM